MYHVVASDLDGTLLSPNHSLSPYAKKTLKLLTTQRQMYFVFATGRHHIDVSQIRDNLDIHAFMITSNGARVYNISSELIFSHNLDEEIVQDLYHMMHDDMEIITNVYRNDEWFINRESPYQKAFVQESRFQYQLFALSFLETSDVFKIYFTCNDYKKLLFLENAINKRWNDRVNVSFSLPSCLEVMAGSVSKGRALEGVAKIIGYTLKECIAFGDGMNDLEMLSMVGKGCIMRNAHQRLKDNLPNLEVIGSNIDDAVPNYLRRMFLA
ncbi:sugar/pyridoxal phosphate phosphatase YigL [Candidatus Gillettellia adelgis]